MPEINLASTSGIVDDNKKYITFFVVSAIIILSAIATFVFFTIQKNDVQKEYQESADRVKNLQTDEMSEDVDMILSVQEQVTEIETALINHVYWSEIMKFLEQQTISTVWYSNMTSSIKDGVVVLSANAGSLMDVAKQLVNFNQNKDVISATIDGINRGTDGKIAFNVTLKLEDNILMKNQQIQEDIKENIQEDINEEN